MPTAKCTTGWSAAKVLAAAAVESLDFKDLALGPAVKVCAERPLQMQHMLHGQLSKPGWARLGQPWAAGGGAGGANGLGGQAMNAGIGGANGMNIGAMGYNPAGQAGMGGVGNHPHHAGGM